MSAAERREFECSDRQRDQHAIQRWKLPSQHPLFHIPLKRERDGTASRHLCDLIENGEHFYETALG